MKIGIDIDNTMTNSSQKAEEYYINSEYKVNGVNSFRDLPETDRRSFLDKYNKKIMKETTLKEGVKEVFEYLNNKDHEIIIITRRGYKEAAILKDITLEYLENNNLKYDKIYFEAKNKGPICLQEKIDLFIDDHLFNLDDVNKYDIPCLLFGIKENEHKYDYVTTWAEVLDYIIERGF